MPDLLTDAQVAQKIGVTVVTLQQWRKRGKGPPYVKEGAWVRYLGDSLDAWLRTRERLTDEQAAMQARAVASEESCRRGGVAMNAKLTKEQRSEKGRKAAQARWAARGSR